jgi:regulator of sigma E protease
MLLGIIAIIIFLSVFVLIHELGHFLLAKKFGLLVEEFGFGLPPRIWGKKIGETIYSINALPFGGFVKILGENREDEAVSGPSEEISITQIEEKIIASENQLTVDEKLTMEKITIPNHRSFGFLSIGRRAVIISAGVLMNFLLGWLVISIVLNIGIPQAILITDVARNSPAAEAGLVASDKILGFSKVDEFIKYIDEHRGESVVLKIERGGKEMGVQAVPRINPPAGQGALGIALTEVNLPKQNFLSSIWEGLKTSLSIVGIIFAAIFRLIQSALIGKASLETISGPVGIVKITAQAGSLGFIYLLQLLALISLNLVVINIFPFPALDGGRLLFLLIEKIKGSPLPAKFERYANTAGMTLLLFLMAVITIKDIIGII